MIIKRFGAGIVLQLAAHLAGDVHRDERGDVGAEYGEHIFRGDAARAHAVDNRAHDKRVREREEENVAQRDRDIEHEHRQLDARDAPEVMQGSAGYGGHGKLPSGECEKYLNNYSTLGHLDHDVLSLARFPRGKTIPGVMLHEAFVRT